MAITKTQQPDGSWKQDPQKDYSNGRKPQQNQAQHPDVTKIMNQHRAMAHTLKDIKAMTSAKDIKARIAILTNAWPSL